MALKSGQNLTVLFTSADDTGAAVNTDSLPTATLYVDGVANAVPVVITNLATGLYRAAVTLPTLAAGQTVTLMVAGQIFGVACVGIAFEGVADTKRVSDLGDVPTVAELEARTLPSADYVVVSDLPTAPDNASIVAILEDTGTTLPAAIADIDPTIAISAAEALAVAQGSLALRTYYSWRQSITSTSTAALDAATKLWLVIKSRATDADSGSVAMIEKAAGLVVLLGMTAAEPGQGSIVVTGATGAWTITAKLDDAATARLARYVDNYLVAELKAQVGADTILVWSGTAQISAGIVNAID